MAERRKTWTWPKLVLATRNEHKIVEFRSLFAQQFGVDVVGLNELEQMPDVEEDGETFKENALKKAKAVAAFTAFPVVADDSGLAVDVLNGAPGVYSARYGGEHGNDVRNNEKLLKVMDGIPLEKRSAQFVCALAAVFPDGETVIAEGRCPGRIAFQPRGTNGFGYDPLFELPSLGKTMAELAPEEKNRISHRARALNHLVQELKRRFAFT